MSARVSFQKQHFAWLARFVHEHVRPSQTLSGARLAYMLADSLAETNSAFDRNKFLRTCGVRLGDALEVKESQK